MTTVLTRTKQENYELASEIIREFAWTAKHRRALMYWLQVLEFDDLVDIVASVSCFGEFLTLMRTKYNMKVY